jgi:hypothetical protein
MLSRRGFLGALTAIVAAPRALFARQQPITLGLGPTYRYKVIFMTSLGELPAETPLSDNRAFTRRLYQASHPDGPFRFVGNVPDAASGYVDDGRGGYFTSPK